MVLASLILAIPLASIQSQPDRVFDVYVCTDSNPQMWGESGRRVHRAHWVATLKGGGAYSDGKHSLTLVCEKGKSYSHPGFKDMSKITKQRFVREWTASNGDVTTTKSPDVMQDEEFLTRVWTVSRFPFSDSGFGAIAQYRVSGNEVLPSTGTFHENFSDKTVDMNLFCMAPDEKRYKEISGGPWVNTTEPMFCFAKGSVSIDNKDFGKGSLEISWGSHFSQKRFAGCDATLTYKTNVIWIVTEIIIVNRDWVSKSVRDKQAADFEAQYSG